MLKAGRRPRFIAKEELFRIPIVGTALRGAGQIPVRRGTGDRTPLLRAQQAVESREVVVIYPEGTVTRREDHLPMQGKTGAVRLSLATGVPITPLASWGSQAVWQKAGKGSLRMGRPIWTRAGAPIRLSLRSDQANDRDALLEMTAEVMTALTELVKDLRARYPRRWSVEA